MAVKASASLTVFDQTDVLKVTTFWQRASSTANPPAAPTTTTTSAAVSGWSTTMPDYGGSYRCYRVERSERGDGTCVWGPVTEDTSWGGIKQASDIANTANSTANTAKSTADANVKSSVQLWLTKANTTKPAKPAAHVTTNDASKGNAWNLAVPTYDTAYPYYYYCWEYQRGDGSYSWSDVVYDAATSENQKNARDALDGLKSKVDTETFNEVKQTAESNSATITQLTTVVTETSRNLLRGTTHIKTDNVTWNASADLSDGKWRRYGASNLAAIAETDDGLRLDQSASGSPGIVIPLIADGCVAAGETVTLSLEYRGTRPTTGNIFFMTAGGENARQGTSAAVVADGEWHTLKHTWTVVDNGNTLRALLIFYSNHNGKWIEIKDGTAMLERGDAATRLETVTNTVNEVRQTATSNSSTISQLATTLGTNADGTSKAGDVTHRVSSVEQDLGGITTRVGKVESRTSVRLTLTRNNWTDANWANYEAVGYVDNWQNKHIMTAGSTATTATGFDGTTLAVGDLISVEGTSTDSKAPHSVTVMVTAVPSSATGAIPAKTVTSVSSKALASRLTSAETSIAQNAEAIELKASKDELTSALELTASGLTVEISRAQAAAEAAQSGLDSTRSWYATSSTAAGTAAKAATIDPATEAFTLAPGRRVYVKFSATNTAAVGSLTLDVNGTGAKSVKYRLNSGSQANLPGAGYLVANQLLGFTYDGTYWLLDVNYNADTYNRTLYSQAVRAATGGYVGTHVIVGTGAGYVNLAAGAALDLAYPILYYATGATTTIAAGGTANNHYLDYPGVTFTTNGTIEGGEAYKALYLKGTVSGNSFTVAASPFMTTAVPASEDGYCYIPLGVMSSATAGRFVSSSQLYAYRGGAFGPVSVREAAEASNLAKTAQAGADQAGAAASNAQEAAGKAQDAADEAREKAEGAAQVAIDAAQAAKNADDKAVAANDAADAAARNAGIADGKAQAAQTTADSALGEANRANAAIDGDGTAGNPGLAKQMREVSSTLSQTAEGLNLAIEALDALSGNVSAWFDFGLDGADDPVLTIGSTKEYSGGQIMSTEISNHSMAFKDGGAAVMELDGLTSTVRADNVEVAETLKVGRYRWAASADGTGMTLVYVEG